MEDHHPDADYNSTEMVAMAADQDQLDVTKHGVEVKPTLVLRRSIINIQAALDKENNVGDQTTSKTTTTTCTTTPYHHHHHHLPLPPKAPLFLLAFQGIFKLGMSNKKEKAARQKVLSVTTAKTLSFS
jgi:hypothetical protein